MPKDKPESGENFPGGKKPASGRDLAIPNFKDQSLEKSYTQFRRQIDTQKIDLNSLRKNNQIVKNLLTVARETGDYEDFSHYAAALNEAADSYTLEHPEVIGKPSLFDTIYTSENMGMGIEVIRQNMINNRLSLKKEKTAQSWANQIKNISAKLSSYGGMAGLIFIWGVPPVGIAGGVLWAGGWGIEQAAKKVEKLHKNRAEELKDTI